MRGIGTLNLVNDYPISLCIDENPCLVNETVLCENLVANMYLMVFSFSPKLRSNTCDVEE